MTQPVPVDTSPSQSSDSRHSGFQWIRWELGLLAVLLVWFTLNTFYEKSSVGKWLVGHPTELYPMSTFSVFLMPKLQGATSYQWEVVPEKGYPPVVIKPYDMFYPIPEAHLEDEITYQFIDHLAESARAHCPEFQTYGFHQCKRNPSATFQLQPDMTRMLQASIQHQLGLSTPPYSVQFYRLRYTFDAQRIEKRTGVDKILELAFYPQAQAAQYQYEAPLAMVSYAADVDNASADPLEESGWIGSRTIHTEPKALFQTSSTLQEGTP